MHVRDPQLFQPRLEVPQNVEALLAVPRQAADVFRQHADLVAMMLHSGAQSIPASALRDRGVPWLGYSLVLIHSRVSNSEENRTGRGNFFMEPSVARNTLGAVHLDI